MAIKSKYSNRSCNIIERNRDFTRFNTENDLSAMQELIGIVTAIEYTWHKTDMHLLSDIEDMLIILKHRDKMDYH